MVNVTTWFMSSNTGRGRVPVIRPAELCGAARRGAVAAACRTVDLVVADWAGALQATPSTTRSAPTMTIIAAANLATLNTRVTPILPLSVPSPA